MDYLVGYNKAMSYEEMQAIFAEHNEHIEGFNNAKHSDDVAFAYTFTNNTLSDDLSVLPDFTVTSGDVAYEIAETSLYLYAYSENPHVNITTTTDTTTIDNAYIYSSVADVTQHMAFAFVTNTPDGTSFVEDANITYDSIVQFAKDIESNATLSDESINYVIETTPEGTVKTLSNVSLTKVFNNLTYDPTNYPAVAKPGASSVDAPSNSVEARYWKLKVIHGKVATNNSDNWWSTYNYDDTTSTLWGISNIFLYNHKHDNLTGTEPMAVNLYKDDNLFDPDTMPENTRPAYTVVSVGTNSEQTWNPSDPNYNSHTTLYDAYAGMTLNMKLTNDTGDNYILFDFGTSQSVNELMYMPYGAGDYTNNPLALELSYSDDNVNFTVEKTWTYTGHTGDANSEIPKIGWLPYEKSVINGNHNHMNAGDAVDCAVFQRDSSGNWADQGVVQYFTQPRGHSLYDPVENYGYEWVLSTETSQVP